MAAQIINARFDRSMQVVFVNGVPWRYAVLEEMARLRREDPDWFIESKISDDGRLVRTVNALDGPRTFDHDVGLEGEVEPVHEEDRPCQ